MRNKKQGFSKRSKNKWLSSAIDKILIYQYGQGKIKKIFDSRNDYARYLISIKKYRKKVNNSVNCFYNMGYGGVNSLHASMVQSSYFHHGFSSTAYTNYNLTSKHNSSSLFLSGKSSTVAIQDF